jgi:hypothetical protein
VAFRIAVGSVVVAGLITVVLGLGLRLAARGSVSAETRAAVVTRMFFRSINARHYAQTCMLMSSRFYHENDVPSRARCVLGLRVGFMWAPSIRFRIVGVSVDGRRAVVSAVANGTPGRIVLVEERGSFRVLSVHGS